jgi:hypothetical protein
MRTIPVDEKHTSIYMTRQGNEEIRNLLNDLAECCKDSVAGMQLVGKLRRRLLIGKPGVTFNSERGVRVYVF